MADGKIRANRAPVLTLWAAVVAKRLGFDHSIALTLRQAMAGLSAHAKGVSLDIVEHKPDQVRERVELAAAHSWADLNQRGFRLYERFRPEISTGESGWGAKGELDLEGAS